MTREPIYGALFALISALTAGGSPLFKTATRDPGTWESAAPEDQPMLLQRQGIETAQRVKGRPTIWTLDVDLMLYVHTSAHNDGSIVPAVMLNPLVDAIEAALTVDDPLNNACTLDGLVSHCAIEGPITYFLGGLGNEAVVTVPIRILVSP